MEIWECLYNAYCDGALFLCPRGSQISRQKLENFANTLNPTPEQQERLRDLINELCFDTERRGFLAGMKVALHLYTE